MVAIEKRIETVCLLRRLKFPNEKSGDTILRALRALDGQTNRIADDCETINRMAARIGKLQNALMGAKG